jgi:hypothetical protein
MMASIPFAYECSTAAGFLPDPNEPQRVGYVTALTIGTTEYAKDLTVFSPAVAGAVDFKGLGPITPAAANGGLGKITVVGVLKKFEWDGGAGQPLKLEFYLSQRNAMQIKQAQESTLTPTKIDTVAWWIADYDVETKKWYEQSFPTNAVSGIVGGTQDQLELDVDLTGVQAKDGIDVKVYKVAVSVAPAANSRYTLHFANSPQKGVAKSWGLLVGKPA